jgi:hypothetical protein
MANPAHQLRYLGAISQAGHVEYGFRIGDDNKNTRLVVLEIKRVFFQSNQLMFQEAPDLCFQKVLADLDRETADSPIGDRVPVTASDIAHYRDLHPSAKTRKSPREIRSNLN